MRVCRIAMLVVIPFLVFAGGCSKTEVIPERLEGQVDRDLRYMQIKDNPDSYRGKLIVTGGKVLMAKRLKGGTRIEVLEIPLSSGLVPEEGKESPEGRFVAMDKRENMTDPAVFKENELVTVVGEVVGSTTIIIDEAVVQVPQLEVKNIIVWDRNRLRPHYPYYGYRAPYDWGYKRAGAYYGYPYF